MNGLADEGKDAAVTGLADEKMIMMEADMWKELKEKVENLSCKGINLEHRSVVLFGAGMQGGFALAKLRQEAEIAAFCDNNDALWNTEAEGIKVIAPCQLKEIDRLEVIITVAPQYYNEIKSQLQELGVKYMTYSEYFISKNWAQFEEVYRNVFQDDISRRIYANILTGHLTGDDSYVKAAYQMGGEEKQYFGIEAFNSVNECEIFADCGAFNGDTLEDFVMNRGGKFRQAYAFEPTIESYHEMEDKKVRLLEEWALEKEQIVLVNKAVSDKFEQIGWYMDESEYRNNRMLKIEGEEEKLLNRIEGIPLDAYFEGSTQKPTFIKADIEGAEKKLLYGARKLIMENHPKLAICIYHKVQDLIELPLLIKKYDMTYKMEVRHHSQGYSETVLYCY